MCYCTWATNATAARQKNQLCSSFFKHAVMLLLNHNSIQHLKWQLQRWAWNTAAARQQQLYCYHFLRHARQAAFVLSQQYLSSCVLSLCEQYLNWKLHMCCHHWIQNTAIGLQKQQYCRGFLNHTKQAAVLFTQEHLQWQLRACYDNWNRNTANATQQKRYHCAFLVHAQHAAVLLSKHQMSWLLRICHGHWVQNTAETLQHQQTAKLWAIATAKGFVTHAQHSAMS